MVIIPVLSVPGTLAAKRDVPASAGNSAHHDTQFVGLLVATVLIVGGLPIFPRLRWGPLAEPGNERGSTLAEDTHSAATCCSALNLAFCSLESVA
jgi:hypothetical protein